METLSLQVNMSMEEETMEDYGKVKAAILQGEALAREKQRQDFRQFCYQETEGPRGVYRHLQELCWQWLKAERCSKEEILELLKWVRECGAETSSQAVDLAEGFLLTQELEKVQEELQDLSKIVSSSLKSLEDISYYPKERKESSKFSQELQFRESFQKDQSQDTMPGNRSTLHVMSDFANQSIVLHLLIVIFLFNKRASTIFCLTENRKLSLDFLEPPPLSGGAVRVLEPLPQVGGETLIKIHESWISFILFWSSVYILLFLSTSKFRLGH
uniref:SCAN box domain-containing protein n=1 Tax=Naja naja TaxID=35670 RepID=A0A8C6XCR6_NAJNA